MAIIKTKFSRGVEGTTNIVDAGTEGTKVASGTTAQRGSTEGQWRYNTTTGFFEGKNATTFTTLEPTPTVTSVDDGEVDSAGGGNQTIVVTGTNFSSGGTITFVGNAGANFDAATTTFNSSTQITAVAPKSSFLNAQEPYKIKFTSSSGLTGTSASDLINVDNNPTWTTASGALPHMWDSLRSSGITVTANDSDGDTIAYSVVSGSLPTGASINSSTGVISGADAVGSDTTSSFTIRATANSKTTDRAFTLTVKPAVTQTFSYTGSNQTFSVPTGLNSLVAYMWGAGGGGAHPGGWTQEFVGGGGGSAVGTINTTGMTSLIMIVGQGGAGQDSDGSTSVRDAFGGGGGNNSTSDNRYAAGGGGLSGIFNGSYTHANSLLIAGGGGGGGVRNTNSSNNQGGAGGGTTGQDGFCTASSANSGGGGTQSAGGDAGVSSNSEAHGSALQGGKNPNTQYGGGGGGGYYGGGAGSYQGGSVDQMGGGGGGSGYKHPSLVTSGTLYTGSGQTPGNNSGSQRGGLGDGGNGFTDGDHGVIVINY